MTAPTMAALGQSGAVRPAPVQTSRRIPDDGIAVAPRPELAEK
jgi:hypothetical protein